MAWPPQSLSLFMKRARRNNFTKCLSFRDASDQDRPTLSMNILRQAAVFAQPPESHPSLIVADFNQEKPTINVDSGEPNTLPKKNYLTAVVDSGSAGQSKAQDDESSSESSFESLGLESESEEVDQDKVNLEARLHPVKVSVEQLKELKATTGTKRSKSSTQVESGSGRKAKKTKTAFWLL